MLIGEEGWWVGGFFGCGLLFGDFRVEGLCLGIEGGGDERGIEGGIEGEVERE